MSFDLPQEVPENMQDIIKSAVDIVNDEFDYSKFVKAFSHNEPWTPKNNNSMTNLSPQVSRFRRSDSTPVMEEPLRSCPTFRQPAFTFDEACTTPKGSQYSYPTKPETGSSDKLKDIMNENNIRKAITDMVTKNGLEMAEPILKLQITGNPSYELDESDVLNIFSRYGKVLRIEVGRHRTAFIVYDDIMNAIFAQKSLHTQYIRHLDIKLYISWSNSIEEEAFMEENSKPQNISPTSNSIFSTGYSKSMPNVDAPLPSFPYNPAKFTCKYEIQIDNDKEFKIARKIIGPKGCNMKKIIEICQYHLKRSDVGFQSDFLKLRLRGRGSGFKEGPEQRESDDNLHLCVSSKYSEVYTLACKLVEDLIGGLYKEYEGFCQKAGRPLREPVRIKRIEIYGGSEKKSDESKTPKHSGAPSEPTLCKSFSRLNISGNSTSEHGSPNNSLSIHSDKDNTHSPAKRTILENTQSPSKKTILDGPEFRTP